MQTDSVVWKDALLGLKGEKRLPATCQRKYDVMMLCLHCNVVQLVFPREVEMGGSVITLRRRRAKPADFQINGDI